MNKFTTIFLAIVAIIVLSVAITKYNKTSSKVALPLKEINNWESIIKKTPEYQNQDSKNSLIIFFDYECPYCIELDNELKKLIENPNINLPNLTYYHRPLPGAKNSFTASLAAECARDQGLFLEYHKELYVNSFRLGKIKYSDLAEKTGINDLKSFNNCIEEKTKISVIINQVRISDSLGIMAVPSIIINGDLYEGVLSSDLIIKLLNL